MIPTKNKLSKLDNLFLFVFTKYSNKKKAACTMKPRDYLDVCVMYFR
jgi:hypothetical protein